MRAFTLVALTITVGVAMARPEPYGHGGGGGGGGGGVVQPGPAVEYTYPAVPPAAKCGHNLLISCNPHHTVIPCSHGHAGGGGHGAGGGYHQEVPAASGHDDQYRHKKWHKKKHHKHHHGGHHGHHYGHHRDASEMGEQMAMDEEMPMAMMQ